MEWLLQVVDEIDDAIGAARHCSLGLVVEIELGVSGVIGVCAIGAAVWTGAEPLLIFAAAGMLSVAAALKVRRSQLQSDR